MRILWRALLAAGCAIASFAAASAEIQYSSAVPERPIAFPRDEGSHPNFKTEWWYLTGWLEADDGSTFGFQVTFFRHRPGTDEDNPSRFAARQLLFAHASLSDPRSGRLLRDEKTARAGFDLAEAREGAMDVHIDDWRLRREADAAKISTHVASAEFEFELQFDVVQPPLLQGRNGFSQKGPYAAKPAYDDLIQGMVALPSLIRDAGADPFDVTAVMRRHWR